MSHTVTLYFDNMIDETHYFEKAEQMTIYDYLEEL